MLLKCHIMFNSKMLIFNLQVSYHVMDTIIYSRRLFHLSAFRSLNYNKITTIYSRAFANLPNLQALCVYKNVHDIIWLEGSIEDLALNNASLSSVSSYCCLVFTLIGIYWICRYTKSHLMLLADWRTCRLITCMRFLFYYAFNAYFYII